MALQILFDCSNFFICRALNKSVKWGNLKFVKFLIEKCGANVNKTGAEDKSSPLHKAIQGENLEVVKYLHQNGADLEATAFQDDMTPLHLAAHMSEMRRFC